MKKYTTSNYVLQLLLSKVEGIKIIDMVKKEHEGKEYTDFIFEFSDDKGKEVYEIIKNFREDKQKKIENFEQLKVKRKEIITRYFKGKKREDNGVQDKE